MSSLAATSGLPPLVEHAGHCSCRWTSHSSCRPRHNDGSACWRMCCTALAKRDVQLNREKREYRGGCVAELPVRFRRLAADLQAQAPTWPHGRGSGCAPSCSTRQRPSILFGVVTGSSSSVAHEVFLKNLRATRGMAATWVVFTYDDSCSSWRVVQAAARAEGLTPGVCEDGMLPDIGFRPKTPLLQRLARHIDRQELVWCLDDDISLESFAFATFFHIRSCAFDSGAPLVVQALVKGRSQDYWPFNEDNWSSLQLNAPRTEASGLPSGLLAMQTTLVEQQMPLFDAAFFKWLMPIWKEVAAVNLQFGTDQGLDLLWCAAAALFSGRRRVSCAVIQVPVAHYNAHTIKKKADNASFLRASTHAREYSERRWSQLYANGSSLYRSTTELHQRIAEHRCVAQLAGVDRLCGDERLVTKESGPR